MYERPSIKALLLLSALSLSVSRNAISDESLVKQGSVLKVDQAAAVRTSPPTEKFLFFVGQPGKTIQMLPRGRTFKVDEVKEISVPFGKDIWVKGKTSEGATGWVYYGDKDKSVNFEKK